MDNSLHKMTVHTQHCLAFFWTDCFPACSWNSFRFFLMSSTTGFVSFAFYYLGYSFVRASEIYWKACDTCSPLFALTSMTLSPFVLQ